MKNKNMRELQKHWTEQQKKAAKAPVVPKKEKKIEKNALTDGDR
jgi:hypothetical protein